MRILLDTNIIIHREASKVMNEDIGQLFNWIDKLKYTKCVHPLTVAELNRHLDPEVVKTMAIKVSSYKILLTLSKKNPKVESMSAKYDVTDNDRNDSLLINELYNERVDYLITEDRKIIIKAGLLDLQDKVFTIDAFLEKIINENPDFLDYKILSVNKELVGNIDLTDGFFDSFRNEYDGFDRWFQNKSEEIAYVCRYGQQIGAFLYLKVEDKNENYANISPPFSQKRRLKIGTFKIILNGLHLGERFLKIVFDNALRQKVDEIYITIFDNRPGQKLLIRLINQFGFEYHGTKTSSSGEELVYVKDFSQKADKVNPKKTFPFLASDSNVFFVSVYPEYHTELFPDAILRTESPADFVENVPHRNAIIKEYISHALERNIVKGDILLFYRTGGIHKGVVTTIAIVDSVVDNFENENEFIGYCQKQRRTVLSEEQLKEYWNKFPKLKPFVVNLLYAYALPKRPNLSRLIDIGIFSGPDQLPRGFGKISMDILKTILKEAGGDESIIGN
jgi:predicted nucleic acid-binding protein